MASLSAVGESNDLSAAFFERVMQDQLAILCGKPFHRLLRRLRNEFARNGSASYPFV